MRRMERKIISFSLDGKEVEAKEGATILSVAEDHNIYIPTLCNHKALEPAGLCRLCTVRVSKGSWSKFVTSCNYPVWEGMVVETSTEEVIEHRKMIVEFLLARCANNDFVKGLAAQFGIEAPMLETRDDDCILCGLCVRMCERIGARAIDFLRPRYANGGGNPLRHLLGSMCRLRRLRLYLSHRPHQALRNH